MESKLIYFVYKRYKGLFKKKHKGNEQFLVFNIGTKIYLFLIIGQSTLQDGKKQLEGSVSLLLLQQNLGIPVHSIPQLVGKEYKDSDNIVVLDELDCNIKRDKEDRILVNTTKKGNYIKSNLKIRDLDIKISADYDSYFIEGDIDIQIGDIGTGQGMKMIAKKKESMFNNLVNSLKK